MKITKQTEADLLDAYHTFWEANLSADMVKFASYLVDDFSIFGSANGEEFFSKQEAVQFYTATADEMRGNAQLRNRKISVQPADENSFVIREQSQLYVRIDNDWTFYGYARISCVIKYINNTWMAVHQHASFPDHRTEPGQQLAAEKIEKENLQLKEAVKRRTVELEQKNKELEIETSLERVRAEAMGMNRPDDILSICKIMFTELQMLGFSQIRNTLINFWDDEHSSLIDYDYSDETGGNKAILSYSSHPVFEQFQKIIKNSKDAFAELIVTKEQLESWKQRRRDSGEYEDPRLNNITALYYYFYSIGVGAIGISTFNHITEEQLNVLKRFRNVFDFAYRRYADVTQAEAQAREAKIETALEKVRSRSLAMHNSDELNDVVYVLFEKLKELDIPFTAVGIAISIEGSKDLNAFVCGENDEEIVITNYRLPYFDNIIIRDFNTVLEKQLDFFVGHYSKEEKDAFYTYVIEHTPELRHLPDHIKRMIFESTSYTVTMIAANKATFNINDFQGKVLADHEVDIIQRFAKVFDQAYTRFLDLQKAEAQAREAQIEAALERVRSRTMTMQSSAELGAVAAELFAQMNQLVTNLWTCGFVLCEKNRDEDEWWLSMDGDFTRGFFLPNVGDYAHATLYEGWLKGDAGRAVQLDGDALQQHYQWLMGIPVSRSIFEEMDAAGLTRPNWQKLHAAYFSKGYLVLITREPCGEEEIFKRFAQVFDLTYTRFLDLQKAEAQAREARIETALERVRSRTMSMQKSQELREVIQVIHDQLVHLGLVISNSGIMLDYLENDDFNLWMADSYEKFPVKIHIPFFDHPQFISYKEAKDKGLNSFHKTLSFEEKNKWFEHIYQNLSGITDETKQAVFNSPGMETSGVFLKNVGLYLINYDSKPYSDEENDILMRFGIVFQQTYTRFLDLEKAEAQAREAEIQLALERVRARSLAMHHTSELQEIVKVVTQQLQHMGLNINGGVFITINEELDQDIQLWASLGAADYVQKVVVPLFDRPIFTQLRDAIKKGNNFFNETYSKQEKDEMFQHLFHFSPWNELPSERKEELLSREGGLTRTAAISHYTSIVITNHNGNRFSEQEIDILMRFGSVFEQSYTRFLDLQKAEAQAREAEIELALERVRARTMAMQSSDELREAVLVINEQLQQLGFESKACNIIIIDKDSGDSQYWVSGFTKDTYPLSYRVPQLDHPYYDALLKPWKQGEKYVVYKYQGEDKKRFDDIFFTETDFKNVPEDAKNAMLILPSITLSTAYFTNGALQVLGPEAIPEEKVIILQRFAKVFNQTYTRFLDLQKAEAQAREAQIELGLERVRARAMAMQKSDELKELIGTVFTELTKLDLVLTRCLIMIYDIKTKGSTWWMANSEAPSEPIGLFIKYHKYPPYAAYINAWQERKNKWQYVLEGTDKKKWDDFIFTKTELSYLPDFVIEGMREPDRVYLNASFNSFGNLTLATLQPLSDEHFDILLRFAKVFDLTYTRFNDLQKAEAQAREAQIELAMERVRSRTMAMHKSAEVMDVAGTLFKELQKLGFAFGASSILIMDKESGDAEYWMAGFSKEKFPESYQIKYFQHPYHDALLKLWKNGHKIFIYTLAGAEKKNYDEVLFTQTGYKYIPKEEQKLMRGIESVTFSIAYMKHGALHWGPSQLNEQQIKILERFAKVFEQSYTRFLDLQKAEAQTRESQIQLALERVRARTMAMQKSDELPETSKILFQQMKELGEPSEQLTIGIIREAENIVEISATVHGDVLKKVYSHSIDEKYVMRKVFNAWKAKQKTLVIELIGEELNAYNRYRNELTGTEMFPTNLTDENRRIMYVSFFSKGMLATGVTEPRPPESLHLLERFAAVFNLTYTRFLDLQNAEAQVREARIEAALERVRSRSLSMHKSEELKDVMVVVFEKLKELAFVFEGAGIQLFTGGSNDIVQWVAAPDHLTAPILVVLPYAEEDYKESEIVRDMWIAKENGENVYNKSYSFDEKNNFFKYAGRYNDFDQIPLRVREFQLQAPSYAMSLVAEKNSALWIDSYSDQTISIEEFDVLKRIAKVFEQAYTRFLDLQKAEAQTREAQIELGLERVRSRAMAMQNSNELAVIVDTVFKELTKLHVLLDRCIIMIYDLETNGSTWWLANPEPESPPVGFFVKYHEYKPYLDYIEAWKSRTLKWEYLLEGTNKKEWDEFIFAETELSRLPAPVMAGMKSFDQIFLNVSFNNFGNLTVSSIESLPDEQFDILLRFAKVFDLTYTRFNDLKQAEAMAAKAEEDLMLLKKEKKRTEEALLHLKETQRQLIQSEKMASLGELTAGIAHEIQNPLNFVNNFSEVSAELVNEMNDEISKGNIEEAKEIASDLKQNLEKINRHGKRAGDIVKGMLQHSRSSSAVKEPTDINKLANEYLRLAYHGLRAKDKSFNATMKTDYDETIGDINIIPQDIGRVILNLITNAFYAASLPPFGGCKDPNYKHEPTIWIKTSRNPPPAGGGRGAEVFISVRDNGPGIPKKILDKIFQPFFTTKPTGQGTGLGLSLSYDIVKAHGGDLKVETKEGDGSTFIIHLPINTNHG